MRIATWNVNSVKQRMPRLLPWLEQRRPDVVCLQETKLSDAAFTQLVAAPLTELGYEFAHHGQGQWNGVAILSRVGLENPVPGFIGQPDYEGRAEARALSATCQDIRIYSLYVPNGREVGSPHYAYKLAWLDALRAAVAAAGEGTQSGVTQTQRALCGDFNVAPSDADVFDSAAYVGHTHVTPAERDRIDALGLVDVVRARWPHERVFSYWDYRAGMFHRDLGMRIDLVLASHSVAERRVAAWVDRQARKGKGPSDHAPVIVDLDVAPDGDIGPMVPPPSNPAQAGRGATLPQTRS